VLLHELIPNTIKNKTAAINEIFFIFLSFTLSVKIRDNSVSPKCFSLQHYKREKYLGVSLIIMKMGKGVFFLMNALFFYTNVSKKSPADSRA